MYSLLRNLELKVNISRHSIQTCDTDDDDGTIMDSESWLEVDASVVLKGLLNGFRLAGKYVKSVKRMLLSIPTKCESSECSQRFIIFKSSLFLFFCLLMYL